MLYTSTYAPSHHCGCAAAATATVSRCSGQGYNIITVQFCGGVAARPCKVKQLGLRRRAGAARRPAFGVEEALYVASAYTGRAAEEAAALGAPLQSLPVRGGFCSGGRGQWNLQEAYPRSRSMTTSICFRLLSRPAPAPDVLDCSSKPPFNTRVLSRQGTAPQQRTQADVLQEGARERTGAAVCAAAPAGCLIWLTNGGDMAGATCCCDAAALVNDGAISGRLT